MNAMLAMCAKDLRLLLRDRMGFFFSFFFPLGIAIFFGTVFSGGGGGGDDGETPKIKVLVVDGDSTPASEKFVKQLVEAPEFKVQTVPTLSEATELLRSGQGGYVGAVHVTKGYGEASERMFWGDPPVLEVYTDPSRKAEIGMFQGLLNKYAFMRMQEMFTNPGKFRPSTQEALAQLQNNRDMEPKAKSALEQFLPNLDKFLGDMPTTEPEKGDATGSGGGGSGVGNWAPVKIESKQLEAQKQIGPPNSFAISFPQGVVWGLIGCALSMGLTLVTERTRGTMVRLRMAPLSRAQLLGSKALACMALTVGVSVVLLLVGVPFGVRPASPLGLAIAILSAGVCFTGIMMLVASLGRTEQAASGLGWASMLVFAMIGGGAIPLFFMPGWLQTLSSISPVKWSILAIEGGIWRGFSLAEMMKPCAVLLGIGMVGFAIGVIVLRRTERG